MREETKRRLELRRRIGLLERMARYLDTERFPLTAFIIAGVLSTAMKVSGANFFISDAIGTLPAYILGFLCTFLIGFLLTFLLRKLCLAIYERSSRADEEP
jgi:hypothetical protein